jgi:4-hydroxybenzoate polyprenyltransferase
MVKWYNVIVLAAALYLSAIYIFNSQMSPLEVLKDWKLHAEVAALSLFLMSGFIINAFYDLEKDMINRPEQTFFDRHISRSFSFYCYFGFSAIAALLSLLVDWKVLCVNLMFSFALWFYSHKMRKKLFMGEVGIALLTVAPFFSLTIFYWNITLKMVEYVAFIFMIIVSRDVIKKIIGMKGDIIYGDRSIPVVYGEKKAKYLVISLCLISIGQIAFFIRFLFSGDIQYYFLAVVFVLGAIVVMLTKRNADYNQVNLLFKLLLLSAVFTIPFI